MAQAEVTRKKLNVSAAHEKKSRTHTFAIHEMCHIHNKCCVSIAKWKNNGNRANKKMNVK